MTRLSAIVSGETTIPTWIAYPRRYGAILPKIHMSTGSSHPTSMSVSRHSTQQPRQCCAIQPKYLALPVMNGFPLASSPATTGSA
jgi:hypothetical protein